MNNSLPLVSIIIPNYNHADYLPERINSVLNQTYKNIEIIILDDCSQDKGASKSVIEKYKGNPLVSHVVYNEINTGSPFVQWEKGLALSKGNIVWIAESDDSCQPFFLEKLVKAYIENNAVIAFCRSIIIDENGQRTARNMQKHLKHSFCMRGKDFNGEYMSKVNSILNASSAVFSKEVALQIDQQFMNYKGSGDWLFWIEIAEYGNVYYLDEALNYFRKHSNNTTEKTIREGTNIVENRRVFEYLLSKKMVNGKQILRREIYSINLLKHRFAGLNSGKRKEYMLMWGYKKYFEPLYFIMFYRSKLINKIYKILKNVQV